MVAVGAALWGWNAVAVRVAGLSGVNSGDLACWRAAGGALVCWTIVFLKGASVPKGFWLHARIAALGVLGVGAVQWLYIVAMGRLSVGVAVPVIFQAPVLVCLAEALTGGGFPRRLGYAFVMSAAGLVGIFWKWKDGVQISASGVAAAIGCAVSYAWFIWESSNLGRRVPSDVVLALGMAWALGVWVVGGWGWALASVLGSGASAEVGLEVPLGVVVAHIVIVGTIVPFVLVARGLARCDVGRSAVLVLVEPVVAVAAGTVVLDEEFTWQRGVGTALVVGALLVGASVRRQR